MRNRMPETDWTGWIWIWTSMKELDRWRDARKQETHGFFYLAGPPVVAIQKCHLKATRGLGRRARKSLPRLLHLSPTESTSLEMLSAACRRSSRTISAIGTQARALHAVPRRPLLPSLSASQIGPRTLATPSALSPDGDRVPSTSVFAPLDTFTRRHVGPQPASVKKMLELLGFDSLDAFIAQCVPPSIRIATDKVSEEGPDAIAALSEQELLQRAAELGAQNKVFTSFIGMGYHQAVSLESEGEKSGSCGS